MQHTLARPFRVEGIALRSGLPAAVTVLPAPVGAGRVFVVGDVEIPATLEHVVDTTLATTLGREGRRVALVEHLCAALFAAGVDNARIEVEGGEIPVLDGSARPWSDAVADAGLARQRAPRRVLQVREPVEVAGGGAWARLEPAPRFELDLRVDFPHPAIGAQRYQGVVSQETFAADLAWARTFGFFRDAEQLRALGIAKGAMLSNTVVYGDEGAMNPDGLRAPDEVVRHKALDAVGDAALLGADLRGRLVASRAGHALHLALLKQLVATHSA